MENKKDRKDLYINLKGKDFVLYGGLLSECHKAGIDSLSTDIIQMPTDENGQTCIVSATIKLKDGSVFSDIGDAHPRNCNKMIIPHLIRMASTRAKARCMRDAMNIGECSMEELGSFDEISQDETPDKQKKQKTGDTMPEDKFTPSTPEQHKIIWTLFKQVADQKGFDATDDMLNKKTNKEFNLEWKDLPEEDAKQLIEMLKRS